MYITYVEQRYKDRLAPRVFVLPRESYGGCFNFNLVQFADQRLHFFQMNTI